MDHTFHNWLDSLVVSADDGETSHVYEGPFRSFPEGFFSGPESPQKNPFLARDARRKEQWNEPDLVQGFTYYSKSIVSALKRAPTYLKILRYPLPQHKNLGKIGFKSVILILR